MKLVIAISSARDFIARRGICHVGWMRQLRNHPEVKVFFGIGTDHRTFEQHVEELPCTDDYRGLCTKTKEMLRVALDKHGADYVFKCDDDTFVHVGRLVARANQAMANGEDYLGATRGQSFCEGGAGYLLSRRGAEIVVASEPPAIGMEDVWVGMVLKQAGITPVDDGRFVQRGTVYPHPDNDQITAHLIRNHIIARSIQQPFEAKENPGK